jgi:hypothetical protein
MMTPEQQAAIVARESAWIDADRFAPLDLRCLPRTQRTTPEQSRDDGGLARDWRDTPLSASASQLRRFMGDPDRAALEQVAEETQNEDLIDDIRGSGSRSSSNGNDLIICPVTPI